MAGVSGGAPGEGVAGVLVVSVSGVLARIRQGYRVSSTQGEGVAGVSVVFTTTAAGVLVSGVLGVVLVSSTRCEGVAGVGDTLGFLLGDRNS